MDLAHLQLFRDIVTVRSISRAAAINGITQSAASQAVQELERLFDAQLLDRSRRPLEVTDAGRLFYDMSRDVLRRRQEFETELEQIRGVKSAQVRVAAIYSVGLSEMARLELEFANRLPGGEVKVEYLRPEKIYQAVADDRVDLGLVSYPESSRDIAALMWRKEKMTAAMAPEHPLASHKKITPADMNGCEFIGFDEELPISSHIDRYFRDHNVKVDVTLRFDNIQSMKEAIRFGQALSVLPELMLHPEIEEGRLRSVPLLHPLFRPLGILHRRRRTLNRATQVFLDVLRA